MRKLLLVLIAPLASMAWAVPAQAADVTVHLDVDVFNEVQFTLPAGDCDIEVADGSDGLEVLDGAVASGCIESYETQTFSFGEFVTCINRVCGDTTTPLFLTFWSIELNGEFASVGASEMELRDGDALRFNYITWLV